MTHSVMNHLKRIINCCETELTGRKADEAEVLNALAEDMGGKDEVNGSEARSSATLESGEFEPPPP